MALDVPPRNAALKTTDPCACQLHTLPTGPLDTTYSVMVEMA